MWYWFTNTDSQAERLRLAQKELRTEGVEIEVKVYYLPAEATLPTDVDWRSAQAVVVSLMGGHHLADQIHELLRKNETARWVYLAAGPVDAHVQGISAADEQALQGYLAAGGLGNWKALLQYGQAVFNEKSVAGIPAPEPMREEGLYYPGGKVYATLADYCAAHWQPDRYTVGMLFLRDDWLWGKTEFYDEMIRAVEAAGMNVLPLFNHWGKASSTAKGIDTCVREFFYRGDEFLPDVIINHHRMSMKLGRAKNKAFLQEADVPVLQAYHAKRSYEEWRQSAAGLTPTEVSSTMSMIEVDGCLHGAIVSHRITDEEGRHLRDPWPYGIDLLIRKAKRLAALRHTPNREKKVAVILHNYPPNNAHIGCAADLDSPASLYHLLQSLQARGYCVGELPDDPQALWERVLAGVTNDRSYLSEAQVAAGQRVSGAAVVGYEKTLPTQVQRELVADWGEAPGDVFEVDGDLLMPGFVQGNVYIGMQPPRGFGEDPAAIIHDPHLVPTHHYLAYYYFLREVWGADAFVHLGTHGSQEWLPGKQTGLSDTCYSLLTMDDMPNFYPYLVTVVGEGLQAKRRGSATVIGYLPAPSARGGLYGEWEALNPLLEEYEHFRQYQPDNAGHVLGRIVEQIENLGMMEYFGSPQEGQEPEYILAIHNFMHDISARQTRTGLHILGQAPQGEELENLVYRLLLVPQGELPALPTVVGETMDISYDELAAKRKKSLAECRQEEKVALRCQEILHEIAALDWDVSRWQDAYGVADAELVAVLSEMIREVLPRAQRVTDEMSNLLLGLEGHFVPTAPGGSPTSGNLETLPTGRNFYGVDPSILPTPTAWHLGCQLGDGLLESYVAEEGRYPEQVGIVVWAGPNMRSNGQCLAEIMYLLGVKPVWMRGSGRVIGLELIPVEDLGRPRIDVTARISGLLRDAMPQVIAWVNKAVDLVASAEEDESVNYIRKHLREDTAQLEAEGLSPAEALKQARYRVFGCPPGVYGAGVGGVLDNKSWQDEADLAQTYIAWGGYAYDENGNGAAAQNLFRRRLQGIDATVKNEDTTEIHLMSSDDFNAFHGGMIAAVRATGGKQPRSYVGDSSQRERVRVRTLAEEFQRVVQGEALNPKFIRGMMKHGHKGALEMAKYVGLSFAWDATSRVMNDELYNRFAKSYVLDDEVREWLNTVNPWAAHEMVETLLEARQRGFWQADEEILADLQEIYLSTEGELEERGE